jgi:hypothetical protein
MCPFDVLEFASAVYSSFQGDEVILKVIRSPIYNVTTRWGGLGGDRRVLTETNASFSSIIDTDVAQIVQCYPAEWSTVFKGGNIYPSTFM